MKAIIQNKYGGPETLQLANVSTPVMHDKEIQVKIYASNIASGDMRINTMAVPSVLKPIMWVLFGLKGPRRKIRGISASGVVSEIGSKVTKFKKGDAIYFINSMKAGCLAEYTTLSEKAVIAKKPVKLNFIEAAPVAFGALSAYHFINSKNVQKGKNVLIFGASGSVGSYALQLAKYYGATVTAVSSKKNHKVLLDLGADHTIDYHTDDFRLQKKKYDVVFDAVGKLSKKSCKEVLESGSKYLSVKMPTKESIVRLEELNAIIEEGKLITLIDSVFEMEEYKEAHELTYSGHKTGNVVLKIV
jgi:NADPH:quinone reductase-like Zn-dependent oxidoreductase